MIDFENLKIFESASETAGALSDFLWEKISGKSGKFYLSLSGGSTPRLLFEILAYRFGNEHDWKKVHFFWGDERCVPPESSQSNFGMTKKFLLDRLNIGGSQIHRVLGEAEPDAEAERYGKLISELIPENGGVPVFDFTILGLGIDGHTASIFPHQIELFDSENNCEVAVHPESGQKRITTTGRVINNSLITCFLAAGISKAEVVMELIRQEGNFENYPAARVENAVWFLDREAAKSLKNIN